jgi:hypothetical protein
MPAHGIEAATVPIFQTNPYDRGSKTENALRNRFHVVGGVEMSPVKM